MTESPGCISRGDAGGACPVHKPGIPIKHEGLVIIRIGVCCSPLIPAWEPILISDGTRRDPSLFGGWEGDDGKFVRPDRGERL